MKKIIKMEVIVSFLLGIVLYGGIVCAASYYAKDVSYQSSDETWEVSNVNDAINDLYRITTLGDATASDIATGKTAVVKGKLVTGTMGINLDGIQLVKYKTEKNTGANIIADEDGLYLISVGGFFGINNVSTEKVTRSGTISGLNGEAYAGAGLVNAKAGDIITTTSSYMGCIVYKVVAS